jgi:RNA polymerase sigma factor (sigma-70 family)
MEKKDWLARNFEETRHQLKSVAYRMLGSIGEAEDAVQEAWIRLNRSEIEKIENLNGWLTTVVARVCLDVLRSRKSRREEPFDRKNPESPVETKNIEAEYMIAASVGSALLVVLDTLTPAERTAFVLHDLFDVPFEEIAPIIDHTETAARQLASRARRQVKGAGTPRRSFQTARSSDGFFSCFKRWKFSRTPSNSSSRYCFQSGCYGCESF